MAKLSEPHSRAYLGRGVRQVVQADRSARADADASEAHSGHFGPERGRQVRLSENGRAAPVHDAERISDLGLRELGNGPVRRPVHRHRRRAVDRQRPEHVQLAPAEHEEHPARRDRPLAGADRRIRNRNRAGHRRRDRRGGTGKAGAEALLRSHHDPLLEPEILRQQRRGHPQRRDDVRRAEHPAAVPARNGQAGKLVRDRNRPEDRAA